MIYPVSQTDKPEGERGSGVRQRLTRILNRADALGDISTIRLAKLQLDELDIQSTEIQQASREGAQGEN